jgi:hypothetical protein
MYDIYIRLNIPHLIYRTEFNKIGMIGNNCKTDLNELHISFILYVLLQIEWHPIYMYIILLYFRKAFVSTKIGLADLIYRTEFNKIGMIGNNCKTLGKNDWIQLLLTNLTYPHGFAVYFEVFCEWMNSFVEYII